MDDGPVVQQLLAQLADLTAEVRAMRVGPQRVPSKTIDELAAMYEATWARETWASSMRASFKPGLRHFAGRRADEISRGDWVHWRDQVRANETTRRKGPPTAFTLNLEFQRWRSFYKWCVVEGHLLVNPLVGVKLVRGKKHRHTRPSEKDIVAILVHCSPLYRAYVIIGARTGMRAGEVRRLEWSQIDLARGLLRVWWHVTKTRREKLVPLTADTVLALKAIRPDVPGRYVFASPRGGHYSRNAMWEHFRAAVDASGVKAAEGDRQVTYHDLRHTFTSWAVEHLPLPVVAAIRGDVGLKSMTPYIQVTERQILAARDELESALTPDADRARK